MSNDDWDDSEPGPRRRRRRRYEDEDVGLRHESGPPRSGVVATAGILSIIQATLFLLCGGFFGICGIFCTAMGLGARQNAGILAPEVLQNYGGFFLGLGIAHLLVGVGLLIGGIVVLQRRNWGRVLTVVLAVVVVLLGLTLLAVAIYNIADEGGGIFANPNPDDRIGQAVFLLIGAVEYLAFSIFVILALLNSHNRAEFD